MLGHGTAEVIIVLKSYDCFLPASRAADGEGQVKSRGMDDLVMVPVTPSFEKNQSGIISVSLIHRG